MKLRPARAEDADAICAIHNPIIAETDWTFTTCLRRADDVAAQIKARGAAFIVAEDVDSAGVIGFATFGAFRGGPGYAQTVEHTVLLAPTARRRGVGKALMQALENVARDQGVHVLVAGISSSNPVAMAFHRARGFERVGHLPEVGQKAGRWLDLILMQKRLDAKVAPDTTRPTG